MDITDLKIFRTVVEEGGITRAAERLHRVQSNVTTRIRQLEADLGVPLFIRAGKKLHLAPAGFVLKDYADRLLALADEARNAVQDQEPRGQLRLGAMESTAAVRLPGPLSRYMERYPSVELTLSTGNPQQLGTAVLAGELDAAFAAEPLPEAPFEKVHAFNEKLVLVAAVGHPPIGPTDVPPTILAFENGCPHRARLEAWYAGRKAMPEHTVQLGSYHAMLGCAVVGMGVALLPESVLATFPERNRLSVHPLPPGQDQAETVLFWRRGASSPKINALTDLLHSAA